MFFAYACFPTLLKDAMAHIWKSLVADSKRTIDEHLDIIIDDLLAQCGSRLWRSREASCLALADIIQGRKFDQVINLVFVSFVFGRVTQFPIHELPTN